MESSIVLPRRRLLRVLVLSLVFRGALSSPGGSSAVCGISCCSVLPTCNTARAVTCDCQEMDTMTLGKGDIPATVRSVSILNTTRVTVEEDAISGLHSLVNFTLSGIGQVEIKQGGMASNNQTKLRSVTLQNIRSLRVESRAFSGVWQPATTIRMHRIDDLHVESNALDYRVADLGPSISLQHVEMLNLKPNGFAAPIFSLALYNVTMDVCREKSFGADSLYTDWNNVTIAEAEARCFHSVNDFATFNIQSVRMQTAHSQAFSGNARELTIKASRFSTIQENGFDIHVTTMELTKSSIEELRPKGLNVLARETLWLERVRIELLRTNALVGLRMEESKEDFDPMLTIRKLELIQTENGSLTFSECTKIRLTDLDLVSPWPRICPTEKWAQALSGGGLRGQLNPAQYQLFFQLFRRRMCLEDGWTKFPISVESQKCAVKHGGGVGDQTGSDAALGDLEDTVHNQINQDEAAEADLSLGNDRDGSAGNDISPEVSNGDVVSKEGPKLPRGIGNSMSTSSAHSARAPGKEGAERTIPKAVPTASSNAEKVHDQIEEIDELALRKSNQSVVDYVVDIKTVEMTFSAREARKVAASRDSEEDVTSHELEESSSTETRGEIHNVALGKPSNDKAIYRISDTPSLVKEIIASEAGAKTRGSLNEIDVMRRPRISQTLSASEGPASLSGGVPHVDQHRLLLYSALGAVLMLSIVLAITMMLLLLKRRRSIRKQSAAAARSSALVKVVEALLERPMGRDDNDVNNGCSGLNSDRSDCSSRHSVRTSVEYHHYEPIRGELLLPTQPKGRDILMPLPELSRADLLMPLPEPSRADLLMPPLVDQPPQLRVFWPSKPGQSSDFGRPRIQSASVAGGTGR